MEMLREAHMLAAINLKIARDKCSPPSKDTYKADFKVGGMALFKNHAPTTAFDVKYMTRYQICK